MRAGLIAAIAVGTLGVCAGCGADPEESSVALPSSGTAYRALSEQQRLAVATTCRDRAAKATRGHAADQIARVDPRALREQLDAAFRLKRQQPRPVAELCAAQLPFVTPGLRVSFDGAKDSGDTHTYETDSDIPLRIRGAVAPRPRGGTVTARRESGGTGAYRGRIGSDGRFALPAIRLRKIADNTFIVAIHAPPSAPRKLYFSAICLDCLAAGTPTDAAR
jgi:hypothetical protein